MIYIGADHRGWKLKEEIKEWLREQNVNVIDLGNSKYEVEDDYPVIAFKLAETVVFEKAKGILVCGSGIGVEVAANKVDGARAGICVTEKQVMAARNDDDMNILCLAADVIDEETAKNMVTVFLETHFGSEERFIRRLNMIKEYESKKR